MMDLSVNIAAEVARNVAAALGIARISDLRAHPSLRFGFIPEFIDRADGSVTAGESRRASSSTASRGFGLPSATFTVASFSAPASPGPVVPS